MKDANLEKDIQKVIQARYNAPHTILEPHCSEEKDAIVIRALIPYADRVSVLRDGRCHQMGFLAESGIREIFIPGLRGGEFYKYEIRAGNGDIFLRSDPYAFYTETPPQKENREKQL